MEEQRKNVSIRFIGLIPTWTKGSRIEGEYEVAYTDKKIRLLLCLSDRTCIRKGMREPSTDETNEGFIINKEDQEKFFKGEGKKLAEEALTRAEMRKQMKEGVSVPLEGGWIEIKSIEKI